MEVGELTEEIVGSKTRNIKGGDEEKGISLRDAHEEYMCPESMTNFTEESGIARGAWSLSPSHRFLIP